MRASIIRTLENMRLALDTLLANKTRAFLTVLGIFIGVLIVVGVASVLNGFRQSVVDQVEEFGTNNVYVYRFPFVQMGNLPREVRNRRKLRLEDAWAIRDQCPAVEMVAAGIMLPTFLSKAHYRDREVDSPRVRGVYPESEIVSNRVVLDGRFFSPQENEHRVAVCVLGWAIADALFPHGGGVGKDITVDGRRYTVVGTLTKRKEGPFGAENEDDNVIMIPYWTARRFYAGIDDHFITLLARRGQRDQAMDEATEVLRRQRRVRWDEDNDFELGTADSIIKSFDEIVFATLAVMFLLSTVGFMVGGVGVMNIMLVSVKERTREIGLRKAVGARRRDIMGQFLTEAMILTIIGGALGLIAGEGLVKLVGMAVESLHNTTTPTWARVAALAGSGGIGLFFGLWPAWKAARLDPIEALRYE